jgi:hypothetical protein
MKARRVSDEDDKKHFENVTMFLPFISLAPSFFGSTRIRTEWSAPF